MDGTILKVVSIAYPDDDSYLLSYNVVGVWSNEEHFNKWYEKNVTDDIKDFVKVEEIPLNFYNEFLFDYVKDNIKRWREEA